MPESRYIARIVDLVEPGKDRLEMAWVRDEAKRKAHLRTAGGREHSISAGALDEAVLVDHGTAGEDGDGALARRAAEVARAREKVTAGDLDLLWEALAGEEDVETALADLAGALYGAGAPPASLSGLGRVLEADGDRFARRARRTSFVVVGRRTRERRRREAREVERREREERERRAAAEARDGRAVTALRAFLEARDPAAWPPELDPTMAALLDSCRLDHRIEPADEDPEAHRHARAVARAVEGEDEPWAPRALAGRILAIRHPSESRTRRTRRLLGLEAGFPPEVEAEAGRLVAEAASGDRSDLAAIESYTLDDPWTRDRDDALAVVERDGRIEVYVHVADVAALVPYGSAVDRAARMRGVTHYWPDGAIPMLPGILAERRASLEADGAPRETLTAHFACAGGDGPPGGSAPSLELLGLHAARIRIAANRTYAEGDDAIRSRAPEWGLLLARLWDHLAQVRRARGGDAFPSRREARIRVEGDGERIDVVPVETGTPAHRVVEELALATGMAVASWAHARELPLVYRIQDAPRPGGRGGERAAYTLTPDRHHALGGALYAHATSPIRRYADLLNQRQVMSRLSGGALAPTEQVDLQRMTLGVRRVLDSARDLERDAHRYWALRWLALRAGEELDAEVRLDPDVVRGARPPRAFVLGVSVLLPLEGFDAARAASAAEAGSGVVRVRVRVEVSDPESLAARATAAGEVGGGRGLDV